MGGGAESTCIIILIIPGINICNRQGFTPFVRRGVIGRMRFDVTLRNLLLL